MRHLLSVFVGLLLFAAVAAVAPAQAPPAKLPNNYRLVFENPVVRVEHVKYGAHERLPIHDHPGYPTVYVYLTESGPVRFTHVEEKAFTATRAAVMPGTYRISPGRIEKHAVENTGDIPSEFLRVELKQVPLGFQARDFRSPKNFDRSRRGVTTEFSSPQFSVRRVIAIGSRSTAVSGPGLFVALTAASIGQHMLKAGEVVWTDAAGINRVGCVGGKPAELLFIAGPPKA